jgi:hypothetical protein
MRVINKESFTHDFQRPVCGVEKCIGTHIVLWSDPFSLQYSPESFGNVQMWRILKGKWIKPQDYISKDNLFYAANRTLANVGKVLYVNFKNHAA